MTIAELVARFEAIALAQDKALWENKVARYNRRFDEMTELELVLKSRDGDARVELLPLLNHRNAQVRIKAALATLVVAPEKARGALQLIVDRGEFPQAADASMTLSYLDDGRFVPD